MNFLLRLRRLSSFSLGELLFFVLFVLGIVGFFYVQSIYQYLDSRVVSGSSDSQGWQTIIIEKPADMGMGGMTIAKSELLFAPYQEQLEWFAVLGYEYGKVSYRGQSFEKSRPQLFVNQALEKIGVEVAYGRLPRADHSELLLSYDFWLKISNGDENVIGSFLTVYHGDKASEMLIAGVAAKGFSSLLKGGQFDFFTGAKDWILKSSRGAMMWSMYRETMSSKVGFRPKANSNIGLEKLKHTAANLQLTNAKNAKLRVFDGLQQYPLEVEKKRRLTSFFKVLVFGLLGLAFCALFLFQLLKVIKKAKEYRIRLFLGESVAAIAKFEFFRTVIYLSLVLLASLLGFFVVTEWLQYKLFEETIEFGFELWNQLLIFVLLALLYAAYLGLLCAILAKGSKINLKAQSVIAIFIALLLIFMLIGLAVMSGKKVTQKINADRNFEIENIIQADYMIGRRGSMKKFSGRLSSEIKQYLNNRNGVESVLVSSATPISGGASKSMIAYKDDGTVMMKESFYAEVVPDYFEFFNIETLSGKIPEQSNDSQQVVINQTFADEMGGVEQAIGKKTDEGQVVAAVVKDAHFVNASKAKLPFSYLLSDTGYRLIVLVKGDVSTDKLKLYLDDFFANYGEQFTFLHMVYFEDNYRQFFSDEIKVRNFTYLLAALVYLFSLFAISSVVVQWIRLNRKAISIQLALGLTVKKMWLNITAKSLLWLTVTWAAAWVLIWPIKTKYFASLSTLDVLLGLFVALLAFGLTMVIIIRYKMRQIDDSFIIESIQNE